MDSRIRFGNAGIDGADHRGWFVGHFMAGPDDLRFTDAVEVKWGVHKPGEGKPHWASNTKATTLSMLIKGRFRIAFPSEEIVLAQEGDYAIWAPGVPHIWAAEQDSVVLSIRWPSQPADSIVVTNGTS